MRSAGGVSNIPSHVSLSVSCSGSSQNKESMAEVNQMAGFRDYLYVPFNSWF